MNYFGTVVFKSPVGFEAIGSPGRGYLVGPVLLTPNFSRKGPNWAFSAAMSTDGCCDDELIGIPAAKK
jgi:hypothetical protein